MIQRLNNYRGKWIDGVSSNPLLRGILSPVSVAFFYGLFLAAYEIKFLREFLPVVHPFLIAWAVLVCGYQIVLRWQWKQIPHVGWLVLFAGAALVTVVLNLEVGIVGGVKSWVLTVLPLFCFYPMCAVTDAQKRKASIVTALLGAAVIIFLASASALYMYFIRYQEYVTIGEVTYFVGVSHYLHYDVNSAVLLYGLYVDTNHAAIYALVFGAYSVFLFAECRRGLYKHAWQNVLGQVFAVINLVVQICYFPFANSRGGWLSMAVAAFFACFCYFFFCKPLSAKKLRAALAGILASVLVVAVLVGGLLALRTGLARASAEIAAASQPSQPVVTEPSQSVATEPSQSVATQPSESIPPETEPHTPDNITPDVFEKESEALGAGRILLWKEALSLFAHKPVFGTTPAGVEHYANAYQVEGKLQSGGAIHNSYLDLLVEYGIVGFVLLIVFWVACVIQVIKYLAEYGKAVNGTYLLVGFCVILVAVAAVFLSCMYISTTAMYFFMLVMAGYLVCPEMRQSNKEVTQGE